jgi:CRISPR-associated protein Csb1
MEEFYKDIETARRILIEAKLSPLQGDRFQPTGFPDLGAAEYVTPDGREMLLVESAQSMANRMEAVCWDEKENDLIEPLKGLPYIYVNLGDGKYTSSIQEAHRINSEYVLKAKNGFKGMVQEEMGLDGKKDKPIDFNRFYSTILKYDINSLIHGAFVEEIDGRLRFPRVVSGFIEASGIKRVQSGGVKFSHVNPKKTGGEGNVPYARTEYVAEEITAYFNLDLVQIRSFNLDESAEKLLVALSIYKILKCLKDDLRLRTACDLKIDGKLTVRNEEDKAMDFPEYSAVEGKLKDLIEKCTSKNLFASPSITKIDYK